MLLMMAVAWLLMECWLHMLKLLERNIKFPIM